MRKDKYYKRILIFLTLFLSLSTLLKSSLSFAETNPKNLIDNFCKLIAIGESKWDIISQYVADENNHNWDLGRDPLIMIKYYKISNPKINNNKSDATIKVIYYTLGIVSTDLTFKKKDHPDIKNIYNYFVQNKYLEFTNDGNIIINYNLVKTENGWKIKNPALIPFEYKDTIINMFKNNFKEWQESAKKGEISKNNLYYMRERKKSIDIISYEEMVDEEIKVQRDFISSLNSIN